MGNFLDFSLIFCLPEDHKSKIISKLNSSLKTSRMPESFSVFREITQETKRCQINKFQILLALDITEEEIKMPSAQYMRKSSAIHLFF